MNYQALVDNVAGRCSRLPLQRVAEEGLPGEHHLYITFQTQHSGVEIASRLSAQYPNEMTIVLQHQFWGLEITEDAFEITLSFSGKNERLFIPFDSVVGFADPSVSFGLQFNAAQKAELPGSSFDAKIPNRLSILKIFLPRMLAGTTLRRSTMAKKRTRPVRLSRLTPFAKIRPDFLYTLTAGLDRWLTIPFMRCFRSAKIRPNTGN